MLVPNKLIISPNSIKESPVSKLFEQYPETFGSSDNLD